MLQFSPQKTLALVWNSADPSDTDTLYVRAVVKDALTVATLETVNLTDQGSNLFTGTYVTPHDPSMTGTGRQIFIEYTVYTDSGYTTKSQNYARVTDYYLIKQLVDPNIILGGGGVDYIEVRKIIKEELAKAIKEGEEVLLPEVEKVDLNPVLAQIKAVSDKVDNIKFPEIPKVEIPEPEKVDLSPLRSSFRVGLERVLRQIKVLPQAPNYSVELGEIKSAFEQLSKLDSFQGEIAKDRETLGQYNQLLLTLDNKLGILIELIKNIDNTGLAGRKDIEDVMDTLRMMKQIPRKRALWKS